MFFLSKNLYGSRPARHFAAYKMDQKWYFVEVCCWTLEIDLSRFTLWDLIKPSKVPVWAAAAGTTAAGIVDNMIDIYSTHWEIGLNAVWLLYLGYVALKFKGGEL